MIYVYKKKYPKKQETYNETVNGRRRDNCAHYYTRFVRRSPAERTRSKTDEIYFSDTQDPRRAHDAAARSRVVYRL